MSKRINPARGPLTGLKIVEIAGIGPGPFCAMLLADLGADILRIDRPQKAIVGEPRDTLNDITLRSRRSVAIDMKNPEGIETLLKLIEQADGLIEGFRPGVMEKLGLGPDVCLQRNPKLVYGRMTGFGQTGPMSMAAGHDINYIALGGALHYFARRGQKPVPPLNLVGDYGGGALYLAFGMMCALWETGRSGQGQVVDTSMIDCVASLISGVVGGRENAGTWNEEVGTNLLDTGAHFYEVYETKDHKFISIGPIEHRFYLQLLEKLGLDKTKLPEQNDQTQWPEMKAKLESIFKTKTRDEWDELLTGTDVCYAPVLSLSEAHQHPHHISRQNFTEVGGYTQPSPVPKFSRTPGAVQYASPTPGDHSRDGLKAWGFDDDQITALLSTGAIEEAT